MIPKRGQIWTFGAPRIDDNFYLVLHVDVHEQTVLALDLCANHIEPEQWYSFFDNGTSWKRWL